MCVGGDNLGDSGKREEQYSSEGRLRPEDSKPYAEGTRASERGDLGAFGGSGACQRDSPGKRPAGHQKPAFERTRGSRGQPYAGKTQSRPHGDKIVIVCAVSGGLCSTRHG
ncbi:hypothetical protein GUJ93_ZPchr0005g14960 [Zizania palustris]|uniref:Uncharacterized protein n=1 Tax=Zizania palustris TaxID=103762 RepID=A0A8J5VRR5_ZIZPA|nr:hypothetical protein GUJ93_ZPchr0005g14960 [Zizania palustris]